MQSFDKDLIELIQSMLTHDPEKRLTAQEVLDHPWMCRMTEKLHKEERY
jgi:serine/threonine protein kinase